MSHRRRNGDGSTSRRNVLKTVGGSLAASAAVSAGIGAGSAAAGSYTGESYNGRYYGKYVPSYVDGSSAVPLVVMMHGCTQGADQFKDETQMNQVAEEHGFIVVYPNEDQGTNSCWNWWSDSHTTRGNGQAAEMVGICDQVKSNHNVDDERVYAAGLSAGGFFVPNLGVEYADYFAAVGVHSGGNYDVVETKTDGNLVLSQCSNGKTPETAGQQAYDRMQSFGITRETPQVVFHGTSDYTVYTCNGREAAERATVTCDLVDDGSDNGSSDYSADSTSTVSGSSMDATLSIFEDGNGNPVVEQYIVDGMGHAWSGGASGGSYTAPGGPEASQHIWDFFAQWTLSGYEGSYDGGGGDDGDDGGDTQTCWTATLDEHVSAGRAYTSGGGWAYYAEGTDEYLGWSGSTTTSLQETSSGGYTEVSSC